MAAFWSAKVVRAVLTVFGQVLHPVQSSGILVINGFRATVGRRSISWAFQTHPVQVSRIPFVFLHNSLHRSRRQKALRPARVAFLSTESATSETLPMQTPLNSSLLSRQPSPEKQSGTDGGFKKEWLCCTHVVPAVASADRGSLQADAESHCS